MTERDSDPSFEDALRQRAIARVGSDWPEALDPLSPEEVRRILHDLRVHQVELDMQNEELRRRQLDLEVSRARYFDLYDLAPVGYLTLNDQGRILEANLTCAALLGVPRGELAACHLSRFVVPEDHDAYYRRRRELFESEGRTVFELRLLRRDAPFWASLEGAVTLEADGSRVCRLAMSDISERKKFEAAKERFESQAHQLRKAESLGRMAGAVAHHFNNMLGGVLGNLELAMTGVSEETDTWELLSAAVGAGRRAAEVSGLMLTYLGQASGERALLDLSEVCSRSLVDIRSVLPRSLLVQAQFPSHGPVVRANANHVRQILNNLITNAWEAVAATHTPIRVSVSMVRAEAIGTLHRFPVGWMPSEDAYACVEVADEGAGIAGSEIPDLFDPFFSSKFVGRGLGLAVVLGIARANGGAITVESWPGEGSVFRFFFPTSTEVLARHVDAPRVYSRAVEYTTVLLVDDEEAVRTMAAIMLDRLGFTVLQASSGAEAVEVCRHRTSDIHCVVCDVTMPGMGGWETLEALRQLEPDMPVVLASGYSEAQVMEGVREQRPDAFLAKPFRMEELNEAVCKALERPRP